MHSIFSPFQEDLWVRKSCDKELFALCVKRNCRKPEE